MTPLAKGGGGWIHCFASCRILPFAVRAGDGWRISNTIPGMGQVMCFALYIHGMGHVMCAAAMFSIITMSVCWPCFLSLWWVFLPHTPPDVCMRMRAHWRSAVLRTDVYDDDSTCVELAGLHDCMWCCSRPCCLDCRHMLSCLEYILCDCMCHYSRPCCSVRWHMIELLEYIFCYCMLYYSRPCCSACRTWSSCLSTCIFSPSCARCELGSLLRLSGLWTLLFLPCCVQGWVHVVSTWDRL